MHRNATATGRHRQDIIAGLREARAAQRLARRDGHRATRRLVRWVIAAREDGMTQVEIAGVLDVSRQYVQRIAKAPRTKKEN